MCVVLSAERPVGWGGQAAAGVQDEVERLERRADLHRRVEVVGPALRQAMRLRPGGARPEGGFGIVPRQKPPKKTPKKKIEPTDLEKGKQVTVCPYVCKHTWTPKHTRLQFCFGHRLSE